MTVHFEIPANFVAKEDDIDGMEYMLLEDEADGWEGEHIFDASVEPPPHPFAAHFAAKWVYAEGKEPGYLEKHPELPV